MQYGLLARIIKDKGDPEADDDCRMFFNISPPSSTFVCGAQGSGKSHTLSCILENCLITSKAGNLLDPLTGLNPFTGLVFHYDAFIIDRIGLPCEAAFLSSHDNVEVSVLCSRTNLHTIKCSYSRFDIEVAALQVDQCNLNTQRMNRFD
ncbi:hypothetical protein BO82DRAFT_281247 [Aspergillus uvarum CBS 121591]|uniref:Uncharacterized protein n=1 Tax=Aspergillus uvarum CBS 121591 TaxID=1448315 RepID=A0A319CE09_9EURO|nr:hypothetical protein BO82DRAFT_281247 [Aspergillus uvarum CBS 121591]PYH82690.1 hypothetical protein BO82DRAFT_281247 [Aspergillus uvarum CBS 121591]